jgi:hypothetical protein
MESLGLVGKIWDYGDNECFCSLENTDDPEDERIDYHSNGDLGFHLLDAIPPSVTNLTWVDKHMNWRFEKAAGRNLKQITEFEGQFPPKSDLHAAEWFAAGLSAFANLENLRMRPEALSMEDQHQHLTTYRHHYPSAFLHTFFDLLSLPQLKTIGVDGYVMSLSAMASLFRFVAT